ncbi:RICIN domain-containing protein [Amycolatopsis sp. Hca4]|uniref:RICIN domain-containing protein n=1 Tax=Amycolatopsis sp. Hca4 TaxID=2742131 RepID=UPI0020CB5F70|nr:RICIN domain-containing protein [Amycolatopsis sp. Hca4]
MTIRDSVVAVSGNAVTVTVPHASVDDALSVTLLPPSDGGFQTVAVAQHSQQCLDNTDLSTADGNRQQQDFCEGGAQQQWNFRPVPGVAGTYTVVNQQSGKCLEVAGASADDGAAVQQRTCTDGATNQQFAPRRVTYSGNDVHDYQLVARHSGKCVDVSGVSTAARGAVIQWTCKPVTQNSPLNQTWRLWGRGPA